LKRGLRALPALLLGGLAILPLQAQVRPGGIPVGRGTLYPAVETTYTADDNLFQRAVDPVQADYLAVGPNIAYSLGLSRNRLEITWKPRYRWYVDDVIPSRSTQTFDGEWELETRGGSRIFITESFERGILEFQDFAGGEQVFAGQDFDRNQLEGGYARSLGPRHELELTVFDGFVTFDDNEELRFVDFRDRGLAGAWAWRLREQLEYRLEARAAANQQERSPLTTFDLATGDPVEIPDPAGEDYDQYSLSTGLQVAYPEGIRGRVFVGYTQMLFKESAQSDYRGPTGDLDVRFPLTRSLGLQVRGGRRPFPSNFNAANYFINDSAGLYVEWKTPRRLTLTVGYLRQRNTYEDPIITDLDSNPATGIDDQGNEIPPDPEGGFVAGVLRTDRIRRLEGSIEFAFIPGRLQGYIRFYDDARTSNLAFAEFDRRAVTAGVRFGWFAP
jgi:hypothetical protein